MLHLQLGIPKTILLFDVLMDRMPLHFLKIFARIVLPPKGYTTAVTRLAAGASGLPPVTEAILITSLVVVVA